MISSTLPHLTSLYFTGQTAGADSDYTMKFFVTVYVYDALPNDVLTVKIGLVVDTATVAVADVDITVSGAGTLPTTGSTPTIDAVCDHMCLWDCL